MIQANSIQEHVQGFRSVHRSQPPSTISIPLDSPEVVHIDCYTDPDTNKDFILWEEIQQAFNDALSVRNRTKMLPFAKGKDFRTLEPRRIAAAPDIVLDVVVSGESTVVEIASMERTVQDLSLITPPQSSSSSARRNPVYGDALEAMQNYNHMDVPASLSNRRGPQIVHDEHKDHCKYASTEQGHQPKTTTKNLLNPQDHDAAANMNLMQTMINANYGDVHAQVALGDRYYDGREVHQDHQAATDWYLMAAEQNHHRAQYSLGLMYDQGHYGVPQDHSKAFDWFLKSALQGYADAQVKVSQAYTNGAGVPKDNIKAMEWSVQAAESGHAGMQCTMGAAFEMGQGVPQSDARSFEWYLKSADQGFAKAQERVGSAFEDGRGVSQDEVEAIEWFTKAADQDLAEAQFSLGRILEGVFFDRSTAVEWLIKAAVRGHTKAQSMLREIYDRSTFNSDPDFALEPATRSKIKDWFKPAAEQGVAHAQVCMGDMYSNGRGVRSDESKAFEWYLKAAEQGDEEAQGQIAYMYETGIGVTKSREMAVEWHLRLAKRGNDWALRQLKDMILK